jgi:hypothetical protein
MRELTAAEVLSKEVVEKALGASLYVDANSHEMVTFLSGRPRPGSRFERTVKMIDLRVPTPRNDVMRDPFLTVELRDDAGIAVNDAEKVLGQLSEIDVPEPNGYTSLSYKYGVGRHQLWVSIGPEPARLLRALSVHRNEGRP